VGLYDLADGARLLVTPETDALSLAALNINARPRAHNFGNLITLTHYEIDRRVLKPGATLHLTLYWQALRPIPANYAVFTHVRGEGETLWAGQDAWPQNGNAPTALWQLGQTIADTYDLTLKPDTPPGQYPIEIGLYHSETLERLQVITADGRISDADFIFLSKIRVEP
jgi:hypothetical protein